MRLKLLQDFAFQVNEENGWHKTERYPAEYAALFHSELSEALEELRKGKEPNEIYFSREPSIELAVIDLSTPAKPEGVPVELADCCIRIFDFLGEKQINIDSLIGRVKCALNPIGMSPGEYIGHLHIPIAMATQNHEVLARKQEVGHESKPMIAFAFSCLHTFVGIQNFFYFHHIDFQQVVRDKIEYNKSRGFRHGGKVM